MAQLKDLLVTGTSRFLGDIYGNLKGTADKAIADGNGNNIASTYVTNQKAVGSLALDNNSTITTKSIGGGAVGNPIVIADATDKVHGLMTATQYNKLKGIADNATRVLVDTTCNTGSGNAIANKTITTYVNDNALGSIK